MSNNSIQDHIPSNPVNGVIVPRPENEKMKREPNPLTWEEKDYFEKTFLKHQPQFYPIIVCGLRTGLRKGELLVLKWEDLDFFNKTIHVQRNIHGVTSQHQGANQVLGWSE